MRNSFSDGSLEINELTQARYETSACIVRLLFMSCLFMLRESNQSFLADSFLFIKLAQCDNYVQTNTVRSGVDITGSVDVIIDTRYVTSWTV